MTSYHAYIARDGNITISPYRGESNRQQIRRRIKRDIGVFDAPDIAIARQTALRIEGVIK